MTLTLKLRKRYWATFDRFEFQMLGEAVMDCSHQGECDGDCKTWESKIDLSKISPDAIRAELKEYGAWDKEELKDDKQNRRRIIWCAACSIKEENC